MLRFACLLVLVFALGCGQKQPQKADVPNFLPVLSEDVNPPVMRQVTENGVTRTVIEEPGISGGPREQLFAPPREKMPQTKMPMTKMPMTKTP